MKTERGVKLGKTLIFVVLFAAFLSVGCASAATYTVCPSGCNYSSIQAAIEAADPGDTIEVHSGTYYENVDVTKQLSLKGVDTGSGKPVVDAGGSGSAITLSADGITLEGFTATNTGKYDAGIKVTSNNDTIIGNDASNNDNGIHLSSSSNNIITGNNFSNNDDYGINFYFSSNNNSIIGNKVSNNSHEGIALSSSSNNIITGNNFSNNDDGIYLRDSSNNNSITGNNFSNNDDGICLRDSSNNNSITGNNFSNNDDGICLRDSSNNNSITGNNVSNNSHDGILLSSSSNNTITGNNVSNNRLGIYLYNSSSNTIIGNNVSNSVNRYGILLYNSRNINIIGNNISNNKLGIFLYNSSSNNITGNNFSNNRKGIHFYSSRNNDITGNTFVNDGLFVGMDSYQNTVENNIVNGKPLVYLEDTSDFEVTDAGQVILVNCNNITVDNLDLSNTCVGIDLWQTEDSIISNNTVSNNNNNGISLGSSGNNTITSNTVSNNNNDGIHLYNSSSNTITGNNARNNDNNGIYLGLSSRNTITGNNVSNNWNGIYLSDSCNIILLGNTFVNDGLFVDGDSYQNTVKDNTVNAKPLIYLEDASDIVVTDAGQVIGQVILVNCNNITVDNLDLSNTAVGIELLKTEDSKISDNSVCNNRNGIYLRGSSSNNTITGNTASNNNHGIWLWNSSNNTITGNTASVNNRSGIYLSSSSNNTIKGNIASNNKYYGIYFTSSSNNTIKGNTASVNNRSGIYLSSSSNNTIKGNTASNNSHGIYLEYSRDINTITNNTVSNNSHGIYLSYSGNNNITGNKVSNNRYGISLHSCTPTRNNKIYLNNFIDNTDNVYSYNSDVIWNTTEEITYTYRRSTHINYLGNYWSDHKEKYPNAKEIDACGIWDTPYSIDGYLYKKDNYPLMEMIGNYFPEENQPTVTSFNPSSPVSDIEGATRTFNITIDQPVNVSWFINETEVQRNTSVTSASYTNTSAAVGTWNVSAIVTNVNGSDMRVWVWNVTKVTPEAPGITAYAPDTPVRDSAAARTFNVTVNQQVNVSWQINGTEVQRNETVTEATYTNQSAVNGTWTVSAVVSNANGTAIQTWLWHVGKNQPPIVSFSYSPANPVVNQTVTFNATDSTDPAGNITYYEWDFGDSGTTTNTTMPITNHTYASAGTFTVTLTVTDDEGATNATSRTITVSEGLVFDTGTGTYPSIAGTHNGTITTNVTITVSKLYTYPCAGTGGHTEHVIITNNTGFIIAEADWKGYQVDGHNITFDGSFTLVANETYNYSIRTGSYPQIIHVKEINATGGKITCTEFVDANGNRYDNWIPAIRLE